MNYKNLDKAMQNLYEAQDKKNDPVQTMALQQIITDLEKLMDNIERGKE